MNANRGVILAPSLSLSSTLSGVLRSFTSHLGTNNRLHYVPFCTRRNANGSPLYCSLVKFATLEKNEAAPPPQSDSQQAPHQCRSDGTGLARRLGAARRSDNAAPHPVERHHPARGRGGEQLAAERVGVGHHAAAGAGHVVGGPGPGVSALIVPLTVQSAAAPRPSGIRCAVLAGTTS